MLAWLSQRQHVLVLVYLGNMYLVSTSMFHRPWLLHLVVDGRHGTA